MRFVLAALLVAQIALLSLGRAVAAPPSDTEKKIALGAHNDFRRRVAQDESRRLQGSVSIPDLSWDDGLATFAQEWADSEAGRLKTLSLEQGKPEHRKNNPNGENLFNSWATPGAPDLSPIRAVQWWFSEQMYYDLDTNNCAAPPGESCGHYTQVVWSTTQRVGCGRAEWQSTNQKLEVVNNVLWVCNYAPPGNITGQRPYGVTQTSGARPGGSGAGPEETTRVNVVFKEMHVNECPEVGKCDWKLACGLGNQAQIELLGMEEGGSRADIPIGRVLTQKGRLPVTVTCTVKERDGPFLLFDAIWENVGTNSITIATTEQCESTPTKTCELRIDQNRDEGDVTVHLRAEVLGTIQQPSSVPPPPPSASAPAAPSGCRLFLGLDSVRCGSLSVQCNAPLPVADEIFVAGRGDLLRSMAVDFLDSRNGRIDGSYSGEGDLVLAVCAKNKGGMRRCSNRFAVTFGPSFCPGPPPQPRPCPDGLRPCPSVPFRCIPPGVRCDLLQ